MGLLDIFKRKDPRANHDFTPEDRDVAKERRALNIQLDNMRKRHEMEVARVEHEIEMRRLQADLEDLTEELEPEDEPDERVSPETAMVMKLIDKAFSSKGAGAPATQAPPQVSGVTIPDERLRDIWASVPANVKAMSKVSTDEQVKEFMRSQLPGIDEDTQNRALAIVRSAL